MASTTSSPGLDLRSTVGIGCGHASSTPTYRPDAFAQCPWQPAACQHRDGPATIQGVCCLICYRQLLAFTGQQFTLSANPWHTYAQSCSNQHQGLPLSCQLCTSPSTVRRYHEGARIMGRAGATRPDLPFCVMGTPLMSLQIGPTAMPWTVQLPSAAFGGLGALGPPFGEVACPGFQGSPTCRWLRHTPRWVGVWNEGLGWAWRVVLPEPAISCQRYHGPAQERGCIGVEL